MSFSLTQIKRNTHKSNYSNESIRRCFASVKGIPILTKNIVYALNSYINYRLKMRRLSDFDYEQLSIMIKELLENCCGKNFLNITKQDVLNNEKEILYQIKKAIYYGATKHLYFEPGYVKIDITKLRKNILPPKRIPDNVTLESQIVKKYFEELKI